MTIRTLSTPVPSAQGLDVSNFQGAFNWAAAVKSASQIAFGIYRLTQGLGHGTNSPDPTAKHNHDAIAAQGLIRGSYHFLDPRLDGAAQARYHVDQLGKLGFGGRDMIWLDNEQANGQAPGQVSACARAFMTELATLTPHNPMGVYTYINFARTGNCNGLGAWPLWLAYPNLKAPAPPPPWVKWKFWQWGTRNGVDADAFNGTAADLRAWIGSFAPKPAGPFRHVADGTLSLTEIAARRNTTVQHLAGVTAAAAKPADVTAMVTALAATGGKLPPGTVYYTTNGGEP